MFRIDLRGLLKKPKDMPLRVAISGPESSGKTTLARELAGRSDVPWVPEASRQYLFGTNGAYEEKDLLHIAHAQLRAEEEATRKCPAHSPFLICDTDLVTIRIWSKEKYGRVDAALEDLVLSTRYDVTLLCRPDIPWEPDPLRENPMDRDRLFELYEIAYRSLGVPFAIIEGTAEQRLGKAMGILEKLCDR